MSKNIKLSYFNGYFSKKPLDSTLEKFIDTIKNNPNANEIEAARNAGKNGRFQPNGWTEYTVPVSFKLQ